MTKGERRETKNRKKRYGMAVGSRSVFTIQQETQKRADAVEKKVK